MFIIVLCSSSRRPIPCFPTTTQNSRSVITQIMPANSRFVFISHKIPLQNKTISPKKFQNNLSPIVQRIKPYLIRCYVSVKLQKVGKTSILISIIFCHALTRLPHNQFRLITFILKARNSKVFAKRLS